MHSSWLLPLEHCLDAFAITSACNSTRLTEQRLGLLKFSSLPFENQYFSLAFLFCLLLLFCLNSLGSSSVKSLHSAQLFLLRLLTVATVAMCCPSQTIEMCPCHRPQTLFSRKPAAKFQLKMCSRQEKSPECSVRRLDCLITFLFQFIKLLL